MKSPSSKIDDISSINVESLQTPQVAQQHVQSAGQRSYKNFLSGVSALLVYAIIQPLGAVLTVYALVSGLNQFEILGTTGCFMTVLLLSIDISVYLRNKHCGKEYYASLQLQDINNNDDDESLQLPYNILTHAKLHSTNIYYFFHSFGGRQTKLWLGSFFLLNFVSSASLYFAYQFLNLGNAITLRSATAIFAIFIEGCILKNEDIEIKHWIVTFLTIIGIIFMAQPSWIFDNINGSNQETDVESNEKEWQRFIGYLCGLTSSMSTAVGSLIIKKIISIEKKQQTQLDILAKDQRGVTVVGLYALTIGRFVLGILFSLIVYAKFLIVDFNSSSSSSIRNVNMNASLWWYLIGIGIITLCMYGGLNYSLQFLLVTESKLIRSTDVIWAFILQVIIFGQIPDFLDIIGVCCIVIPVTALNVYSVKKVKAKQSGSLNE